MYSDPTSGSMEARIIDGMLNAHPEFAGVKRKISKNGEGGQAVARGEGQMALQLICEIINHPDELSNVGPVPDSLGAYIDSAAGGDGALGASQGSGGVPEIRYPARHLFAVAGPWPGTRQAVIQERRGR